jgi:hypothetical protein
VVREILDLGLTRFGLRGVDHWGELFRVRYRDASRKGVRLRRAQIAVTADLGVDPRSSNGTAKLRKWTDEETMLLIELAQRKERVPAMARERGRHIASARRRARELDLLLPQGREERQL